MWTILAVSTIGYVVGFFGAVITAMAVSNTNAPRPLTPTWVDVLANWGHYRPRSPFKRPPRPHNDDELGLEVYDAAYVQQGPEEPDEWGDPDGTWVDELHEYAPRHRATDD